MNTDVSDKPKVGSMKSNDAHRFPRYFLFESLMVVIAIIAASALAQTVFTQTFDVFTMITAGIVFTLSVAVIIRLSMDPDSARAQQSDVMLRLSSSTLDLMQEGLTTQAAQRICKMLLPNTAAIAVAITDKEFILGYAGFQEAENASGSRIRTQATHEAIADGKMRVLRSASEIGFPTGSSGIKAAIIVPLVVGGETEGTLKFYYRSPKKITETQTSIAHGFGRLISTEIAATRMEMQRKLATSMELKMLQSQINPHFLFNTINTIASLIRTDPMKARTLLRDFAVFYRRTLEDSTERITLAREIEQTMRYLSFEVARFGEDRIEFRISEDFDLQGLKVPPFIIQPLVENAVLHAMPSEGKLIISVMVEVDGNDVIVVVADDGIGMDAQTCNNILHPESSTGMGIAVKNVHDRMKGFFGTKADMKVESELGVGTTITLRFPDCAAAGIEAQGK